MNEEPSRKSLERAPARVLSFLRGVGTTESIRSVLATVGYTQKQHEQGWALLHKVAGYQKAAGSSSGDKAVRDAIAELNRWDEPNFRRIRATLARLHPAQLEVLFEGGLEPTDGFESVVGIAKLLDRLDALEKSGKPEDAAAISTLAERGYTAGERKRLRDLVALAQSAPDVPPPAPQDPLEDDLKALHAWWFDWSETARVTITRRDHLIRLGLASRRRANAGDVGDEDTVDGGDAPAPTPTPTN